MGHRLTVGAAGIFQRKGGKGGLKIQMPGKLLVAKGITRRWLLNVFTVFAGVIVIAEVTFSLFYSNYYYGSLASAASSYAQAFNVLALVPEEEFEARAREYAEQFEFKHKVEIQIIDSTGEVFVSTSGFQPTQANMPDYNAALKSSTGSATWRGKSSSGQGIYAGTYILGESDGVSNGAVRWVVSTENVTRHILMVVGVYLAGGIFVLGFAVISGLYFVKSIVRPVQEVTSAARKIAMGDFGARIDSDDDGEIGALCDSINYIASELGQTEKMKNDFISSESHELRTPLTAIRGWGETIKMSIGSDPELVSKGIDVILNEAGRLSGLVEELLDFSRMQSGSLSMNMTRFRLIDTLDEAVYMYNELARRQNIELVFVKPKFSPLVMGDADRLKQVFINIIDNAIKYNKPGGQVLIESSLEEGCVRITVTDTGSGIPSKDIDRVKEKFYKADKTVRGSGIGLAVADEIVKQHQGLLFLESKEGVGTTVTIVIPTIEEATPEEGAAELIPPSTVTIPGEASANEEKTDNEPKESV